MKSLFKIYGSCRTVNITPTEYSDGATKVNFPLIFEESANPAVYVEAKIKDSIGLVALPSITNRIREEYEKYGRAEVLKINLILSYMPHARQDRYTGDNAFTLKYSVIPLIKAANIDLVTIEDPHSQVSEDLLRQEGIDVLVIDQLSILKAHGTFRSLQLEKFDCVIAPDAGSIQRAETMAAALNIPVSNIVKLEKTRNPNTGHISFKPLSFDTAYLKPLRVVMFDDIGDGCWTHILAAEVLKNAGVKHVTLVLTHGIFSKGIDHLPPTIDELIVLNDWREKPGFKVTSLSSF